MNDMSKEWMDLLSETSQDSLESFLTDKVQHRIKELRERQKRLSEELSAINHELEVLSRHVADGEDGPSVQAILAKVLKS